MGFRISGFMGLGFRVHEFGDYGCGVYGSRVLFLIWALWF